MTATVQRRYEIGWDAAYRQFTRIDYRGRNGMRRISVKTAREHWNEQDADWSHGAFRRMSAFLMNGTDPKDYTP